MYSSIFKTSTKIFIYSNEISTWLTEKSCISESTQHLQTTTTKKIKDKTDPVSAGSHYHICNPWEINLRMNNVNIIRKKKKRKEDEKYVATALSKCRRCELYITLWRANVKKMKRVPFILYDRSVWMVALSLSNTTSKVD